MSDVVKLNGGNQLPATEAPDPFLTYGGGGGSSTAGAELLIYSKGEYYHGLDRVDVPLGTRMVFFMPGLRSGWRKWEANRIADEDMMLLVERPRVPLRNSLGDTDMRSWEGGRDPWQESIIVDVANGSGERFTMPLSGVGGIQAGKQLCVDYGKGRRSRPGCLPLVELQSASYQHDKYGKIHKPILSIVGWVDEETLEPVEDIAMSSGDLDKPPFPKAASVAAEPLKPLAGKPSARAPRF